MIETTGRNRPEAAVCFSCMRRLVGNVIGEGLGRRILGLLGENLRDVASHRRSSPKDTHAQQTYGLRL